MGSRPYRSAGRGQRKGGSGSVRLYVARNASIRLAGSGSWSGRPEEPGPSDHGYSVISLIPLSGDHCAVAPRSGPPSLFLWFVDHGATTGNRGGIVERRSLSH